MKYLIFVGCMGVLAGCAGGQPAADDSLARPVDVQTGAVTDSQVTFTIAGGYAHPSPVTMQVGQPVLKLHTTAARAVVDGLSIPLGDVHVPAMAFPPNGLVLRNLLLKAGPAKATILQAQDDALDLRAALPLELDWSVELQDGSLYPLGPVHTAPVDVDVHVFREDGRTTAIVEAACHGTCWSVDGVATMSDGKVYLEADAQVTPAP